MTKTGQELVSNIVSATGLPQGPAETELSRILNEAGLDPARATLDEIRTVMANYLQDVLSSVCDLSLFDYDSEVGA